MSFSTQFLFFNAFLASFKLLNPLLIHSSTVLHGSSSFHDVLKASEEFPLQMHILTI